MKTEIKKSILSENPLASKIRTKKIKNVAGKKEKFSLYCAELSDGYVAAFGVPHKENGEQQFANKVESKLLIDYLI